MSYSRWSTSHWYTFWMAPLKNEKENRDTALFSICNVSCFTTKQLRENLDRCLGEVKEIDNKGDIKELKLYIKRFLKEVDETYDLA